MWCLRTLVCVLCSALLFIASAQARILIPYGYQPGAYGDFLQVDGNDDGFMAQKRAPSAGDMMVRFG
ncbi:unnamed protein product, partial [Mesorhabditis spiculigera]